MQEKINQKAGSPAVFAIWILAAAAAVLFVTGCQSPRKKIAAQEIKLRSEWETNLAHQSNLPDLVLDWEGAVSMMMANNLKLRQARIEMTNAQEQLKQVFKDLIPSLNLRSGISKKLADFDTLTADDVTFSADSFFNIPGFVSFGTRWYGAKLYQLRTRAAYQLAEREQMVDLYRLFFSAEEYRDEAERLDMQRATAQAMTQVDPFSGRMMTTELQSRELALARSGKTLQDSASELLGTREYRFKFSTNGLPDLRYHEFPLPLSDTSRVAQLQMKLLAVELEAARAQLFGLKLRYWPELNIFISGPPIYQVRSGRDTFWDAEELRASADLFWTIDTRGNLSRSIRQMKRQQELQKQRYRQETLALMDRLLFTQKLIQSVQKQLARVEGQLALLTAVPPAQNYFSIQKYAFDYRSLASQELQLRRELSELNALFWFVDEDAWKDQHTALPGRNS